MSRVVCYVKEIVVICQGGGIPYHVTYPMIHMMLPTSPQPHVDRQMPVKAIPFHNYCCGR